MKLRIPIAIALALSTFFIIGLFMLMIGWFSPLTAEDRYFYRPRVDVYVAPPTNTIPTTTAIIESSNTEIPDLCPTPCDLEPPDEEDYEIMRTLATGEPESLDNLPIYLRNALITDRQQRGINAIDYTQILQYIHYEDLKNIVLLISYDSQERHEIWDRFRFIEELTGMIYDDQGYPVHDLEGMPISHSEPSRWMQEAGLEEIKLNKMIQILARGMSNKDPRIRILCVRILREMGPLPSVYDEIQQFGRSSPGTPETVGSGEYGWFIQEPQVLTRRYCYCDIDGIHKPAVPFMQFAQYESEIQRFVLVKQIEVDASLEPDDFKTISPEAFFALINQSSVLGFYGADRATEYTRKQALYPILPVEELEVGGENLVPANRYIERESSYKYIARQVLYDPYYPLSPEFLVSDRLFSSDIDYLIDLFMGALENRSFAIRKTAADFLYRMYLGRTTNSRQKDRILQATLYSRTLREVMRNELTEYREQGDHIYLDRHILDNIRSDIEEAGEDGYDEPLGGRATHSRIQRRRNDDGEYLPEYLEQLEAEESNESNGSTTTTTTTSSSS